MVFWHTGKFVFPVVQEGSDLEREVKSPMDFGEFGDLVKYGCISWGVL